MISHSLYGWDLAQLSAINQSQRSTDREIRTQHQIDNLKFSIVIPTLNQGDTIEETILSILGQSYNNCEIIIIDGGSTDNTKSIIQNYRSYISYYESKKDNGQSEAINRGFSIATGDIFAWINSDDYYLPSAFATVNNTFLDHPSELVCIGAGDVISKDHKFLRHISPLPLTTNTMLQWLNDQWFMQQCCFWRKTLWQDVGGVDESLHLLMDYDLWFKFAAHTQAAMIKSKLAVMRYYPNAKTVRQRELTSQEMAYVLAKHSAAEAVRTIVSRLTDDNLRLKNRLTKINSLLSIRVLKRLRLLSSSL